MEYAEQTVKASRSSTPLGGTSPVGEFYTSIALLGPSQNQVAQAMQEMRRDSFVSDTRNGVTVVFDRESEEQEMKVIDDLASNLTERFCCTGLAALDHDGDVLVLSLFREGHLASRFTWASPLCVGPGADAMDGGELATFADDVISAFAETADASKFHEFCSRLVEMTREDTEGVAAKQYDDSYLGAMFVHQCMAEALGIDGLRSGRGYNYLSGGLFREEERYVRVDVPRWGFRGQDTQ